MWILGIIALIFIFIASDGAEKTKFFINSNSATDNIDSCLLCQSYSWNYIIPTNWIHSKK